MVDAAREGLIVRLYTENDYEAVAANLQAGGLLDADRDTAERLKQRIEVDPASVLVAELDGEVVGSVYLPVEGVTPFLFHAVVAERFRRQGIGTMLVEEGIRQLRQRDLAADVEVFIKSGNRTSQRMFSRLGFVEGDRYVSMWRSVRSQERADINLNTEYLDLAVDPLNPELGPQYAVTNRAVHRALADERVSPSDASTMISALGKHFYTRHSQFGKGEDCRCRLQGFVLEERQPGHDSRWSNRVALEPYSLISLKGELLPARPTFIERFGPGSKIAYAAYVEKLVAETDTQD